MGPQSARVDAGITRREMFGILSAALGGATVPVPHPDARGDERRGPTTRVYAHAVYPRANRGLNGILAIDPEAATWARVTTAGNARARVSPDGRLLAYLKFDASSPRPETTTTWVLDLRGDGRDVQVFDRAGFLC